MCKQENKCRKTIIVLGCPRCGTSMVTGVLRHMGIYMGEKIKKGKHEDVEILWQSVSDIAGVVLRRNREQEVWGWKDPNCAKYINEILPLLINPFFVYIVRNADDAIQSDMDRGQKSHRSHVKARNKKFTATYEDLSLLYPTTTIEYEWATEHKLECVIQIAKHLKEPITDQQIIDAVSFIQPGAYRNLR